MIDNGTIFRKDLLGGGIDKEGFLVFDLLNNFELFRENQKGKENRIRENITEKTYNTKIENYKRFSRMETMFFVIINISNIYYNLVYYW